MNFLCQRRKKEVLITLRSMLEKKLKKKEDKGEKHALYTTHDENYAKELHAMRFYKK